MPGRTSGAVRALLACALFCASGAARARADESAVTSTSDRAAESAYDALRALSSTDAREVEELARRFLVRFPRDPLAPRVELEVGRAMVLEVIERRRGASSPPEARVDEALSWLTRSAAHADAPCRDRANLYRAAALAARGDDAAAIALLAPLEAALILPEDRALHLELTLAACRRTSAVECVLHALDERRRACHDENECGAVDDEIRQYTEASVTEGDAIRFARDADPSRATFVAIANRAVRAAALVGDWDAVSAIADRAARAGVDLDADSRELARRLELGRSADPRVVGVISGLSGPDAEASMAVVAAVARAAGLPPSGPLSESAFRIVVRDHRGDPDEAARAVSELYWVHRAIAVIGPLDAPSAATAAARADQLGVALLSLAPLPRGAFVVDAAPPSSTAWLRDEAERRFGRGLGLIVPIGARAGTTYGPDVYAHAGGRFDAATRAQLRRTTSPALLVVARPAEVAQLVRSIDAALGARRRTSRPAVVIDRRSFERIVAIGRGRSIEGAIVIEREAPERVTTTAAPGEGVDHDAEDEASAAALAFERIRAAAASTRERLAAVLGAQAPPHAPFAVRTYAVRRSMLVPLD